jgi:hypothetical protein
MRHRLPGRLASLAALLRSMPTARGQGSEALARFWRTAHLARNPLCSASLGLGCSRISKGQAVSPLLEIDRELIADFH